MATDFFAHQDAARRKTGLLVFYLVLATILIITSIYLVAAGVMVYARQQDQPQAAVTGWNLWDPALLGGVTLGTLTIILGGSAYKVAALNGGGESVARLLGGQRIDPDTSDPEERRILNVVEEMAIASGTPVPSVFLLNEPGINAFAAGYTPGDAVIGITRGSLDYLTRDELQGVVAHEFSHILNGDMRLNIRLIGILHGILLIALVGYILLRSTAFSGGRSRRRGKSDGRWVLAMIVIGVALVAIGYIGVFFGRLIKSAVSRQREFLADASAVQFTRNPEGISGALKKIGGLSRGSRIENPHAEEASHLFFGNALARPMFGLLATHPPLPVRIKRIDPSFDGTFPPVQPLRGREPEQSERPAGARKRPGRAPVPLPLPGFPGMDAGARVPIDAAALLTAIGTTRQEQIDYASDLLSSLPDELRTAARRPRGAQAVIYGLILGDDPPIREHQERRLREHAPSEVWEELERLGPAFERLADNARVPLVELTFPALRNLSRDEYRQFRGNVEVLVKTDRRLALFEYTLRQMLLRHLDSHFAKRKPPIVQYYALRPLLPDCAALVSCLAHMGQKDAQRAAAAFAAGAAVLTEGGHLDLLSRDQCNLNVIAQALSRLTLAAPQIKKRLIAACVTCIASDNEITVAEAELLRAIADALDCPMPPLAGISPAAVQS
jgi:Zn-dependent protease with chaperone function